MRFYAGPTCLVIDELGYLALPAEIRPGPKVARCSVRTLALAAVSRTLRREAFVFGGARVSRRRRR